MVSAPIFDGPWKDIPVILCYSRKRVPADLQTLLSKIPLTEENSIPIEEFNKNYNITVLEQPYYIKQTLELIRQLQPEVKRIAFISDNRYISVVTRQAIKEVMQKDFPNLQLELLSSEQISTEELLDTLTSYKKRPGSSIMPGSDNMEAIRIIIYRTTLKNTSQLPGSSGIHISRFKPSRKLICRRALYLHP